jgi:hypothetical protein
VSGGSESILGAFRVAGPIRLGRWQLRGWIHARRRDIVGLAGGTTGEERSKGKLVFISNLIDPFEEPGGRLERPGRIDFRGRGKVSRGASGFFGGEVGEGGMRRDPGDGSSGETGEFAGESLDPFALRIEAFGGVGLEVLKDQGDGLLEFVLASEDLGLTGVEGAKHPTEDGLAGFGRYELERRWPAVEGEKAVEILEGGEMGDLGVVGRWEESEFSATRGGASGG